MLILSSIQDNIANFYLICRIKREPFADAAEIMKKGIKYMDAAHISAAIIAQCDFLITTDKKLLNYKSDKIKIINPIDFIRIWENENAEK